jgi:POT family proton-dependent oligopeptide transporter
MKKGMLEAKSPANKLPLSLEYTAGGGETLEGAGYYWFFTRLMLITAVIFVPFAMLYKPHTYLHDNTGQDDGSSENT